MCHSSTNIELSKTELFFLVTWVYSNTLNVPPFFSWHFPFTDLNVVNSTKIILDMFPCTLLFWPDYNLMSMPIIPIFFSLIFINYIVKNIANHFLTNLRTHKHHTCMQYMLKQLHRTIHLVQACKLFLCLFKSN